MVELYNEQIRKVDIPVKDPVETYSRPYSKPVRLARPKEKGPKKLKCPI